MEEDTFYNQIPQLLVCWELGYIRLCCGVHLGFSSVAKVGRMDWLCTFSLFYVQNSSFPFPNKWLEFLHFEKSDICDSSVSRWKHFTANCLSGSSKSVRGSCVTAAFFPRAPHQQAVMLIYRSRAFSMRLQPHVQGHRQIQMPLWMSASSLWHWKLLTPNHIHWQLIDDWTHGGELTGPSNIS